jgi:hypothetical protein
MAKYQYLKNKIAPLILAVGLASLPYGCASNSQSSKSQNSYPLTDNSPVTTNKISGLGVARDENDRSYLGYQNQAGETILTNGLPIQRDLPNNSAPIVVFKGLEGIVHISSNHILSNF